MQVLNNLLPLSRLGLVELAFNAGLNISRQKGSHIVVRDTQPDLCVDRVP